jgi:hypothetical protein
LAILACAALTSPAALVLAGCGSTKKSPTAASTSSSTTQSTTSTATAPATGAVGYEVRLTGSGGASALANLDVKASDGQLCWRFSQLKNVTISHSVALPSIAVIQLLHQSRPRLVLGIPYKSSGCIEGTLEFLTNLATNPHRFRIGIFNTQTGRDVRGHI